MFVRQYEVLCWWKFDFFSADTGELIALPPFADSLSNSSLNQVLDMINNQVDNSGTISSTISNDVVNPFEDDTPGDGVYYCNQSSNGITTNFVNTAYPSFNSKQVRFFWSKNYCVLIRLPEGMYFSHFGNRVVCNIFLIDIK